MGNSLQDQLLKAGLVDTEKAKKIGRDKRKQDKQRRHAKAKPVDENHQRVQQEMAAKAERDRKLNLRRQEQAERSAVLAQVRQMVESNRQPKGGGEFAYNFVDGNKIKRLYVSEAVHKRISSGKLAIVRLGQQYELVSVEIAEKIRSRDEHSLVFYNDPKQDAGDPADPYADHPIPDDLIW
jgi:uncharacterized protein YaiL (DUF2058 family)